jgi:hypothetical protein
MNLESQIHHLKGVIEGATSPDREILLAILGTLSLVKQNLTSPTSADMIVSMSIKDYRSWEEYKLFLEFKTQRENQ